MNPLEDMEMNTPRFDEGHQKNTPSQNDYLPETQVPPPAKSPASFFQVPQSWEEETTAQPAEEAPAMPAESQTPPAPVEQSGAEPAAAVKATYSAPPVQPAAPAAPVQSAAPTAPVQPGVALYGQAGQPQAYHGPGGFQRNIPPVGAVPYPGSFVQNPQPRQNSQPYVTVAQEKPKANTGKKVARAFAMAGVLVLLLGLSCGITALLSKGIYTRESTRNYEQVVSENAQLKKDVEFLENALKNQALTYDERIAAMEKRLNQAQIQPSQGANGELLPGMMTPTMLYAQCVSSVVAISNQAEDFFAGYTTVGTGSGFILTEDGYVVSNHHVVDGAQRLMVTMSNGMQYEAVLVGSDNINDVALLKIESDTPLPAVTIGKSSELQVGDQVVAIGNPLGNLTATATVGYIGGKDRPVNTDGTIIDMLQTDAAINSGNSGGPLFSMYGEVVGITTAKYSGTTNSGATIEGIGFAIPIDDVYGMLQDFKEHGYITGGYLGVVVSSVNPEYAAYYQTPVGAYVQEVTAGSCAEKAGIQTEDIITKLEDYDVGNLADLTRALRNFKAGDQVTILVYRDGSTLELTAVLDEKPAQ